METHWDVIVLGAGGAGLFCAARAAARGRRVLALDHADKLGKKILISGGGRCNFTNTGAGPANYQSTNEHFAKSALSRYRPDDFLALARKHEIPFYEKKLGQQFCRDSAQRIVDLLLAECREAGARIELNTKIEKVGGCDPAKNEGGRFFVRTERGTFYAESLVVATGGLSIPKIGATDLGYRIAKQFELKVTELAPALVSLTMGQTFLRRFGALSGVSVDSIVSVNGKSFRENILLTHTGLSGPAILQVSLHWKSGDPIEVNLSPERDLTELFLGLKKANSRKELKTVLGEIYSDRFAEALCEEFSVPAGPLAEKSDQVLRDLARRLHKWELHPVDTGGYGKAEVTRGGVSTDELSSKTLESKKVSGLYFIGEVVDVTGWLGGYNFQWAWASAAAAAEVC
ncbi:MAG: NAD(P)/FAD-dependent oxidoreductase [Bdellovibrionota bacterium]